MKKILVIGSGPIVIGQAAEFDYAGTQACKSLKEEGYQVVLINSNPATIMTDREVADAIYIEPLTPEFCERVIERERPDGLVPTLGGQTGLNLATQLAQRGVLEKYNVKLLGTPLSAIQKAEDREEFRKLMREIREPVPESWIIQSAQELEAILDVVPYPCIIRPAYTLGGTGGGIANTREELWEIGQNGLKLSMRSQIMVERSLLGWKEVEYEVMRDRKGNCITICNMENLDPMGVHTGDSIVVAPSQTLSDIEYHMLRTASVKIIRALGIEGGCNVQIAVNPESFDYYLIEVNPRVSRSSALASKATGYPIARISAKIAVGRTLDEIENPITGTTKACFEPALDYCVVKIPRWPFDKFPNADRTLFTQMKATGEVMAIDRSFERALLKAIRGLEVRERDFRHARMTSLDDDQLELAVKKPTDERLWALGEAIRRGWTHERIHKLSRVDHWFLCKIGNIIESELELVNAVESEDAARIETAAKAAIEIGYCKEALYDILGITSEFRHETTKIVNLTRRAAAALGLPPNSQEAVALTERDPVLAMAWKSFETRFPSSEWRLKRLKATPILDEIEITGGYKMVDTCAGEFESSTPYFYASDEATNDAEILWSHDQPGAAKAEPEKAVITLKLPTTNLN